MLGKISGQSLNLAKMHIANHVVELERAGEDFESIETAVRDINDEYKLVKPNQVGALSNDVTKVCDAIRSPEITSIDRGGYWKLKATNALSSKKKLARQLKALQA